MYVIQRCDGDFVAHPGQENSYTDRLQDAWAFRTRWAAENQACEEDERVVDVDALFQN